MSATAFFTGLLALCGQAFEGRVVSDDPTDTAMAAQRLVMHVRECKNDEIRIPFHVGADRSRTWVITRTDAGLRLKHDHRHDDGTPDAMTMYGGDSAALGSATRQEFPVDAESIDLFHREGRSVSTTNTWALEHRQGRLFAYALSRPAVGNAPGRRFRVEFDLTTPVEAPPAPWGAAEATTEAAAKPSTAR
ncbi:MAG: hypothetical protein ACRC2H_02910 [Silanimonas sp.]